MFSSGKVPHRPEDNLAMTALLPSVYLFSKVYAFEQNNSLAAFKHISMSQRLLIWWLMFVCPQLLLLLCVPVAHSWPSPTSLSGSAGAEDAFAANSVTFSCLEEDSDSIHMAASRVHVLPLQTGAFRVEWVPLSHTLMRTCFQMLFFLFLSTESCFCCLPSLGVRDRHTSCVFCVCVCVHARVVGLCAWMSAFVSTYVWVLQWSRSRFHVSAKCGEWFRYWRTASRTALGFPLCSEEPNAFIWCWIFVICPWNYNWKHLIPVGPNEWSSPYQHVDINWAVSSFAILYSY